MAGKKTPGCTRKDGKNSHADMVKPKKADAKKKSGKKKGR